MRSSNHKQKFSVLRVLASGLVALSIAVLGVSDHGHCASEDGTAKTEAALTAFAKKIGAPSRDDASLYETLTGYLKENPDIYGAAFAFAPTEVGGKTVKSVPYVYRKDGKFVSVNLVESYKTDYTHMEWYAKPAATRKPSWTEPYFDEGGGNVNMVTYSIPVFAKGSTTELLGVVTSDLPVK